MKMCVRVASFTVALMSVPFLLCAQDNGGVAGEIHSLHAVLENLYNDMMPLCSKLIGVGRGIAGFAATWYIASRIWRHISNAEPVDFYPLFRPFVLGFAVLIFPSVIGLINGVMQPTVTGTADMIEDSDKAISELLRLKEEAIKKTTAWQMYVGPDESGDRDKWYQYTFDEDPSEEGWLESVGNSVSFAMAKLSYKFRNAIKEWLSEVLKVLYEAAALCINTIRTFHLVVLAILGPLVFGIAVFDGFQHTLTVWIARYMNIFLWLPVANIFGAIMGKIQENMLQLDLSQIEDAGDTFFSSTDMAYLIFMIIGIAGYFTVPSIANYIIHAGGGNALLHKISTGFTSRATALPGAAINTGATMARDVYGDAHKMMTGGMMEGSGNDYFKDKLSGK
ncbi:MAG: conjugative transposon protein TraJ [Sphingobacteriales bacterium]|nr:conjugative transposon protein TraJ [Sphingobacteriales bacterium]OJW00107.1 MAG: conjugative transposon protein TraJ [Sphingobacteriales bacterium 44-61]